MEINGTVDSTELEFTVEVDADDIWRELEDYVNDAAADIAREAAQDEWDNRSVDVDFAEGASQLLNDYSPGTGCQLARDFEMAVRGAVSVNDWLKDIVLEQVGEHRDGNPQATGLTVSAVRSMVRTEIRHALADASSAIRDRQLAEPTA